MVSIVLTACALEVPKDEELQIKDAQFIGHTIDIFDNAEHRIVFFFPPKAVWRQKESRRLGISIFQPLDV